MSINVCFCCYCFGFCFGLVSLQVPPVNPTMRQSFAKLSLLTLPSSWKAHTTIGSETSIAKDGEAFEFRFPWMPKMLDCLKLALGFVSCETLYIELGSLEKQ